MCIYTHYIGTQTQETAVNRSEYLCVRQLQHCTSHTVNTEKVAWNFREVINLLAPSFQAQEADHRISFTIYEQAKEFISQPEDSFAELTPAPSDPKKP